MQASLSVCMHPCMAAFVCPCFSPFMHMCICVCLRVSVHVSLCTFVHETMCLWTCASVFLRVFVFKFLGIHASIYLFAHTSNTSLHLYMFGCEHVCIQAIGICTSIHVFVRSYIHVWNDTLINWPSSANMN